MRKNVRDYFIFQMTWTALISHKGDITSTMTAALHLHNVNHSVGVFIQGG